LTGLTRLVLTNAIYFKSDWAVQFHREATLEAPFYLAADRTVPALMMQQIQNYGYVDGGACHVVALPYRGAELTMDLIVPKEVHQLAEVERMLPVNLPLWLEGLAQCARARKIHLVLPRFRVESCCQLSSVLQTLGIIDAFRFKTADFTGITAAEPLFLSQVIHKAYCEVNEEGTEAAAATAEVIEVAARPEPEEQPLLVRADRPFFFQIRHGATGAVLFMGRVTDPRG
jgi:serpin B